VVYVRATMSHDSASHRVFNISELTRFITGQLIPTSQASGVNLACACRHLEEPVLSTLWETQRSLNALLEVLPGEYWEYTHLEFESIGRKMVRGLGPFWRHRTLKFRTVLAQDHAGSLARGLEQSPALCVLDATGLRG